MLAGRTCTKESAVDTFRSTQATEPIYTLAEGPIWDARSSTLHWVDIPAGAVIHGRLVGDGDGDGDGESIEEFDRTEFGASVGAVGLATDGGLIVAAERGLATIDPSGGIHRGPALLADGINSRMNDAACDPAGRYLVGSLALGAQTDHEVLLCVEPTGPVSVMRDDIALSNGIAWSADGRTVYHVDTLPGRIWTADYDRDAGVARRWRVLFTITDGFPDGMVLDTDGMLWIAIWGAGQVRRYDTAGTLLAVVTVDAPHVSCPAFAGADRGTLVISTARTELTDAQLTQHPFSGSLFIAHPGATGLPENLWAGDTTAPRWGSRIA
jgi:sugar lactone lactonase YvrE